MFVRSAATILHADADAFYASVEQRDDPALRGRPVIVGPGVVMAASYEARAHGVRGGMGAGAARRLCPEAVFVSPRFAAYVEASRQLFAVFERFSPVVEPLSIEEAFLDVGGLERICGPPPRIAARLRREVRERVGLPLSVGIASTKVLAKIASRAAKPDGMLLVEPGRELEFLHPLAVERLWGVGAATAERLRAEGITTVGRIAELPAAALIAILGPAAGRHLHAVANNRDPRPVRRRRSRRSFGAQAALGRGPRSRAELELTLASLVDRIGRRMRAAGRVGRTVILRMRFADYARASRSRTLAGATAATAPILATARSLLAAAMPTIERRGITLLGIALTGLDSAIGVQLELPLERRRASALEEALDEVRERFGAEAITRAALLGRDPRFSAYLLE